MTQRNKKAKKQYVTAKQCDIMDDDSKSKTEGGKR